MTDCLPLARGVLVVGTGLIGTSVALALHSRGVRVFLEDASPAAARMAKDLGGGVIGKPDEDPDLVVVAVPPPHVPAVVVEVQRRYVSASVMDLASVKSHVLLEVETLKGDLSRFVGGHPMAGRERSGAVQARADLFEGRAWVLCPTDMTSSLTLERAEAVVACCGADPLVVAADRHDLGVALVSHLPQVLASAMAARLTEAPADLVALAGPGVRDVTRIAAGDPELWTDILSANAQIVLGELEGLLVDLEAVRHALYRLGGADGRADSQARDVLHDLILRGGRGQARLPGKHGGRPTTYTRVSVVVTDEPGQLAGLFNAADRAGINVEDVTIEHAAGHPVGVVELHVQPVAAADLAAALLAEGWNVHG